MAESFENILAADSAIETGDAGHQETASITSIGNRQISGLHCEEASNQITQTETTTISPPGCQVLTCNKQWQKLGGNLALNKRLKWGSKLQYITTNLGFAVGLGNIWRFPYLVYRNGGGAFFIPYIFSVVFMAIPLFFLESAIGQFASLGPTGVWEVNILFKGLGISLVLVCTLVGVYYNVIMAAALYYTWASFASRLPWLSCDNVWNTCNCRAYITDDTPRLLTRSNCNVSNSNTFVTSAHEFFIVHFLNQTEGFDNLGGINNRLTGCNLVLWIVIACCLLKGIKSLGLVAHVCCLLPYVILTIINIKFLPNAGDGIDFYLVPDFTRLKKIDIWISAASQVFFSIGACTGSLTAMASYSHFDNDVVRDSITIPVANGLTSFYAGFAIFGPIGYLTNKFDVSIDEIAVQGSGLIFEVYPTILATLPAPQFWNAVFFLMIVFLGLGSNLPTWETVLTAIEDEFPKLKTKTFRAASCLVGFLLGLPITTRGGWYVLDFCDWFVGYLLLMCGMLQFLVVVWIYGLNSFTDDIIMMIGHKSVSRKIYTYYLSWNLAGSAPLILLGLIVYNLVEPVVIMEDLPGYPEWAESAGWMLVWFCLTPIPVWFVYKLTKEIRINNSKPIQQRKTCLEVFTRLNRPSDKWVPALPLRIQTTIDDDRGEAREEAREDAREEARDDARVDARYDARDNASRDMTNEQIELTEISESSF